LFNRLIFSNFVLQAHPSQEAPDDSARNEFKEKTAATFADPSPILALQDEVHFEVWASVIPKWTPAGSNPGGGDATPGRRKASNSGYDSVNRKTLGKQA
jgi:hypothetical protein